MKHSVALPAALLACAAIVAGCGTSQLATTFTAPTPGPPLPACTNPPGYQFALSYPEPANINPSPAPSPTGNPTVVYAITIAVAPSPAAATPAAINFFAASPQWGLYVVSNIAPTPAPNTSPLPSQVLPFSPPKPIATPSTLPTATPAPSPTYDPGWIGEQFYTTNGAIYYAPGATWNVYLYNTNCFPGVNIGSFNS